MKILSKIYTSGPYTFLAFHGSGDDLDRLERLGIFQGEEIILVKNQKDHPSLVIENLDADFVLDKQIADYMEMK